MGWEPDASRAPSRPPRRPRNSAEGLDIRRSCANWSHDRYRSIDRTTNAQVSTQGAGQGTRAERRDRATADTRASILEAARASLLAVGYANLSTRRVAEAAEVPLSQIHYHFGSKQQLILAVLEAENERLLERQAAMYAGAEPLWRQWERACDYLEEDLESGYVRILQEMIAAGWSDAEVAAAVRELRQPAGSGCSTDVARARRSALGGLGPFTAEEVAALMGLPFLGAEAVILLGITESTCRRGRRCARSALLAPADRQRRSWMDVRQIDATTVADSRPGHAAPARRSSAAARPLPDRPASSSATACGVSTSVYGDGDPTILLLPTWSIIHSRQWKAQIPYLARHFRVVTFDGRGNGRSDRPTDPAAYADDRVRRRRAAPSSTRPAPTGRSLVGLSHRRRSRAIRLAADAPGARRSGSSRSDRRPAARAAAAARRAASADVRRRAARRPRAGRSTTATTGGATTRTSPRFFFAEITTEPHSTKAIEDAAGWALETDRPR